MNGADRATGRRPRTPSAQVASELLNAAESVLVKVGVRGLTVRAAAAEAGVAPMSVYDQFGGKAGLLAALPLRGLGRLETAIEADKEADARARLVSVNVKHGRPRPAKAVMRVSRATLLAHSPETTHDARTGRRCLTPRRIWRQAVKGDKHGA